ncbi:MAG: hypothetical protein QOG64_1403 [Acidimicrobiaceae bacterium]|nr:hypothetical protein [Acidimicrobiaceae bacterium]
MTSKACEGRVVIVTGAGRGIGRAHALALAGAGAAVVVNDLGVQADGRDPSSEPADGVVAEVLGAGGEAVAVPVDVASEEGADRLVATALKRFGRLDAVVNNAGILRSGLLLRTTLADWRAVLDVHLTGTFLLTRAAAVHWRERAKAGDAVDARVVNTSSTAGLYGFVGEAAYSAAKAGIVGFTLTAAAELQRYGVTVNAIAPAALTRLTAWAAADDGAEAVLPGPALVSPLVVWLVSSDSAGVTGRVFEVGGGEITVVEGWRPGQPVRHAVDDDPVAIGQEVRARLAEAGEPVPVFVPGTSEGSP